MTETKVELSVLRVLREALAAALRPLGLAQYTATLWAAGVTAETLEELDAARVQALLPGDEHLGARVALLSYVKDCRPRRVRPALSDADCTYPLLTTELLLSAHGEADEDADADADADADGDTDADDALATAAAAIALQLAATDSSHLSTRLDRSLPNDEEEVFHISAPRHTARLAPTSTA